MEWPHTGATGRHDSIYSQDGIEPLGLHSEHVHGRRTQEIRFSETVGDKKRVNIHSEKYATRWDPEFSPGVRHRKIRRKLNQRVSRPAPYDEIGHRVDPRVQHPPRPSPPRRRRPESHHAHHAEDDDPLPVLNSLKALQDVSHSDHSDDSFKVRRESGHIFNFRLKKLQSIEQAPTQAGPEVPSSTSGVRKWASLRLKKDELFQENEFRVQRSRYNSNLSALQYSIADLVREEPHKSSSDSQPLLLQWKYICCGVLLVGLADNHVPATFKANVQALIPSS